MIVDLGDNVGNLLLSLGVANVGKFADVLEGVGRPGSAELFNLTDHKAETVKVLGNFRSIRHHLEVLGKDGVDEFAVLELLVYGGVVLITWVQESLRHEEVEFVLAGVNILALVHSLTKDVILKEGDALILKEGDAISLYVLKEAMAARAASDSEIYSTLEVTNWFRHKAEVTELHDG